MKKYVHFLLAFLLAFTLAACGSAQKAEPGIPEEAVSGRTAEAPEEEPENETGPETLEEEPERGTGIEVSEEESADESGLETDAAQAESENTEDMLSEDGTYTSKEDVSLYLYLYGHLPDNFITKKEAEKLGWSGGSLEPYAPGMCIGGNRFGNYEGLLPEKEGRTYTECDIDTLGADKRGAKRIVFSSDGLIYYTEDHYESFELLYGEEE